MAVTYSLDLYERAQAYAAKSVGERRYDEGLTEISALLSAITGEPDGGCRQCQYSDYFARLRGYILEAPRHLFPETVKDTTYTFAPGFENEVIVHESYNKAVTSDNLTDEDAVALLKLGYEHAIIKKPGADKPAAPAGDKPLTEKQQLQARYKELYGDEAADDLTIAKLKEAIAAKQDPE